MVLITITRWFGLTGLALALGWMALAPQPANAAPRLADAGIERNAKPAASQADIRIEIHGPHFKKRHRGPRHYYRKYQRPHYGYGPRYRHAPYYKRKFARRHFRGHHGYRGHHPRFRTYKRHYWRYH